MVVNVKTYVEKDVYTIHYKILKADAALVNISLRSLQKSTRLIFGEDNRANPDRTAVTIYKAQFPNFVQPRIWADTDISAVQVSTLHLG